jgi:hypothetical protein
MLIMLDEEYKLWNLVSELLRAKVVLVKKKNISGVRFQFINFNQWECICVTADTIS